jgi:hypothetical protein
MKQSDDTLTFMTIRGIHSHHLLELHYQGPVVLGFILSTTQPPILSHKCMCTDRQYIYHYAIQPVEIHVHFNQYCPHVYQ